MNPLVGIQAKLNRAEQQIERFSRDAQELCATVTQSITPELSDDGGKRLWIYRGETPQAPIEWSVILGEILYNLRSALDHLVWQLVLANGETPGPHNAFVVAADHDAWLKTKNEALKGVSSAHQDMLARLQPYTSEMGFSFKVRKLRTLHELQNVDKHRHLILTVVTTSGIERLGPETDYSNIRSPQIGSFVIGEIRQDRVLLELDSNLDVEPAFKIGIRIANKGVVEGAIPQALDECFRAVRGCVACFTDRTGNVIV